MGIFQLRRDQAASPPRLCKLGMPRLDGPVPAARQIPPGNLLSCSDSQQSCCTTRESSSKSDPIQCLFRHHPAAMCCQTARQRIMCGLCSAPSCFWRLDLASCSNKASHSQKICIDNELQHKQRLYQSYDHLKHLQWAICVHLDVQAAEDLADQHSSDAALASRTGSDSGSMVVSPPGPAAAKGTMLSRFHMPQLSFGEFSCQPIGPTRHLRLWILP